MIVIVGVTLRMTTVMARPTSGSAIGRPSPTRIALATTPSETKPSTRAWLPSAIRAGLEAARRRAAAPGRRCSLPRKPATPARASAHRCVGSSGWTNRSDRLVERDRGGHEDREDDEEAGQLLAAVRAEEERDAERQRRERRRRRCAPGRRGAPPSRTATKTAACTPAVAVRIARLIATVFTPARERTIERSTSPCEWPCPSWPCSCGCACVCSASCVTMPPRSAPASRAGDARCGRRPGRGGRRRESRAAHRRRCGRAARR